MFDQQCAIKGVELIFKTINHVFMELPIRDLRVLMEPNRAVESELPQYLNGDQMRLRQVLVNLISNSIKFSVKGKQITVISAYD